MLHSLVLKFRFEYNMKEEKVGERLPTLLGKFKG